MSWLDKLLDRKVKNLGKTITAADMPYSLRLDNYEEFGHSEKEWSRTHYDKLSKESYEYLSVVSRCINLLAGTIAAFPLGLFDGDNEVNKHDILDRLKRPNKNKGLQSFIRQAVIHLMVGGENFIWFDRGEVVNRNPLGIWNVPPSQVRVEYSPVYGDVAYYDLTLEQGGYSARRRVEPDSILFVPMIHPRGELVGLSPLSSASRPVDKLNEAALYESNMLKQGGKPPLMVKPTKESQLEFTDPQVEAMKKGYIQMLSQAKRNGIQIPWFMKSPFVEIQELGFSPADLQLAVKGSIDKVDVCNAFGVPPELVGLQEHKTYSNMKEARQALVEDEALPLAEMWWGEWSAWLGNIYPGWALEFKIKRDEIKVMQEAEDLKTTRLVAQINNGLATINEAREVLGRDPVNDPMAKQLLIGGTLKPLTDIMFDPNSLDLGAEPKAAQVVVPK